MTSKDKKIWEDEGPVHVTWLDYLLDIVIVLIAAGVILFGSFIVAKAKAPGIPLPIAGANKALMDARINAERQYERRKALEEEERQRLEKEKAALEEKYKAIFGYVPSEDEIQLLLAVTMAECGNTEPGTGIERVIEVIANRCRDGRFPSTITEVCYQRNQFETVSTGAIWRYEVNERVRQAWNNILSRGKCMDESVAFFTAGGYNRYCRPAYKIGNHYFGY